MYDRSEKHPNDPINKDRKDKEKYESKNFDNNNPINRDTNRANVDADHEDDEKKGLMDKIMDFFSPDDDADKTSRDQNKSPVDRDDTFPKNDNIRDPLYTLSRDTRNKGILESDYDSGERDKVLVGIFDIENEAINVVTRLNEIGYWEDEISAVAKDKHQTQGGEGKVGTGTTIGGSLGGLAVALPALGPVEVPGYGPLLSAGPIAGVFRGVITGGVAGGLVGGLVQMGVREEDAKEYEQYIQQGKILILVENRDSLQEDVTTTFTQNNSIVRSGTRELAVSL